MVRTYAQSQAWYERAQRVTPGASQTSSKAPGRVGPLGAYPLTLERGRGCYVWEIGDETSTANNKYCDWYGGNCAMTLGHSHPEILFAVRRQLEHYGVLLPLPSPLEAVVAEEICRLIPCAEQVRFVKTGSESTEAAIRVARAHTGRDVIVLTDASYHCYDDQTEILTSRGFKLFRDVKVGDLALTLSPDGEIQHESILETIGQHYSGPMVRFTGPRVRLLVTPNHRMVTEEGGRPGIHLAQSLIGTTSLALSVRGRWAGISVDEITIPDRRDKSPNVKRKERQRGSRTKGIRTFKANRFLKFLGYFIAEGWTLNAKRPKYEIQIAQNRGAKRDEIRDLVVSFGFKVHESEHQIQFASKELWYFLRQFGSCASEKRVPDWIKSLSSELLQSFLDGLIAGDGTTDSRGCITYYTTSPRLSDDIQEIGVLLGMYSTRRQYANDSGPINGKVVRARKPIIHVDFCRRVVATGVSTEQYDGSVFCVRVPSGIICVRREGRVLWCGNSWHAWYAATKAQHPGVPEWMAQGVKVIPHGDFGALRMVMSDDIAMVFIEPQFHKPNEASYLRDVQALTSKCRILFGLDEMVAGGRLALGGAQEAYGLKPDLATFGKAFAQGLPLAFVCGRRDIMAHATVVSGTFGGELLSLAACQATLKEYQERGIIARIYEVGQQLMDGFNGIAARLDVPVRLTGHPCRLHTTWTHPDVNLCQSLFQQELAERGVLTHYGAWNPSAAHTADAIEQTFTAVRGSLETIATYLRSENAESFLRGERIWDSLRNPHA